MPKTTLGNHLENATMEVKTIGVNTGVNPETGNPIYSEVIYTVNLYLKFPKQVPRDVSIDPPNSGDYFYVEGWVTDVDNNYPEASIPGGIARGIPGIIRSTPTRSMKGVFWLDSRPSNGAILEYEEFSHLGQPVWGWFRSTGSV